MTLRSTTRPLYFLKLWFQLRILEMTEVHQRREMNSMALSPCFSDHLTSRLLLTFVSCHARLFFNLSHSFSAAAFASGIFIDKIFVTQ